LCCHLLTPTRGFLNKVAANVDSAGFVFVKVAFRLLL
jgi:hypothetical protein